MKNLLLISTVIFNSIVGFSQKELLQAGPMNGYTSFKEVAIWVQTTESAKVSVVYWDISQPGNQLRTIPKITSRDKLFATKLIADQVKPGKAYNYLIEINNIPIELSYPCTFKTPVLWQWRNQPPAFSILAGSCTYVNEKEYDRPGKPYGGDYQIFTHMANQNADLMLWLGDNTYYREVDWDSKTGIYHRNTHTRSLRELQPLLAKMNHYAIWDDHDFGPNDAVGTFYNKKLTRSAFKDFWPNPNFNVSGGTGISGQFSYGDIDFFLLDNRWNRTPVLDSGKSQILGEKQLKWLKMALKNSRASFKIVLVGGQFLNPNQVYENMSNYPEERADLIAFIRNEKIKNVVFLTGDRHHSEISRLVLSENHSIYDITASPLTSRAHKKLKEKNPLRIENSAIKERNYAKISFTGKMNKRELTVDYYGADNKHLFTHTINQE